MLGETIKRLRESAGMSQGELADRLSVVRQTVSKWERGLSAPDAAIVVRMAEIFGVPVQEILGVQADTAAEGLQEELAQARALLEEKSRKERERKLADQKRGVILLLSFAALFGRAGSEESACGGLSGWALLSGGGCCAVPQSPASHRPGSRRRQAPAPEAHDAV